jgi:Kae1-associated kinase Bud32
MTNMLEGNTIKNEEKALKSYLQALKQIEKDKLITQTTTNTTTTDNYITVSKEFALKSQKPRVWLTNLTKTAPRAILTSFFGIFPKLLNITLQNTQALLKTQKINLNPLIQTDINPNCYTINPQKYIYVPISNGLVSLANKITITEYIKKTFPNEQHENITITPIGGILNDVYLIKAQTKNNKDNTNNNERKIIVKRFKDWSGFKWFPLTIWTFGTHAFSVSGKARLSKECATSEFLRQHGFNVPKIFYVSNPERLIFMEYIEGKNLSHIIKHIAAEPEKTKTQQELRHIETVGELFAKIHSHGMTLGDTKPENIIVNKNNTLYLIDFEQAIQDGDKTWDIAVFLYYAGHYIQLLQNDGTAEAITEAFIKGYIKGGGEIKNIKKITSPKYTRIFSVFTLPSHIISIINTINKTVEKTQKNS